MKPGKRICKPYWRGWRAFKAGKPRICPYKFNPDRDFWLEGYDASKIRVSETNAREERARNKSQSNLAVLRKKMALLGMVPGTKHSQYYVG